MCIHCNGMEIGRERGIGMIGFVGHIKQNEIKILVQNPGFKQSSY